MTHGPDASGDEFPIRMRNRVHVRGVSARRCVIRGVDPNDPNFDPETLWDVYPGETGMECLFQSNRKAMQVLVTYRFANRFSVTSGTQPYWWAWAAEVDEVFDGFTLQGGDVQVSFDMPPAAGQTFPLTGRISNCIFDMRHMPEASPLPIPGPEIGLLLSTRFDMYNPVCGYFDEKVHVTNNTFILAEYNNGAWVNEARMGAVGLVNTTDPHTSFTAPFDGNRAHRGLASPGIQNNVFRTRPANLPTNTGRMAMIGIDATDCLVRNPDAPTAFVSTNAFAPARVGTTSALFRSTPGVPVLVGLSEVVGGLGTSSIFEPAYYEYVENPANPNDDYCSVGQTCTAISAPLPTPVVALWNGAPNPVNEHDAGFVGEFLVGQPGTPVLGDYADWRLLPGSPLIDKGRLWQRNEFQNGSIFVDHPHEKLSLLRWDGEGWGNTRVHGEYPDIGFDEFHLGVMAGSYANGSNSHNRTTHLNPSATASQSERRVLLPTTAAGTTVLNATLRVKATERQVALPIPPWTMPAWSQPPVTLASPLVDGQLPAGYQAAYINFAAERWTVALNVGMVLSTAPAVPIPGYTKWSVVQVELPPDDEGPNYTSHFNTQFVLDGGAFASELRGNLQPEYR